MLQLWLPFPEAPEPLGNACPREGEPSGCHRHVEPHGGPGPGPDAKGPPHVAGSCTGTRAASAHSAAACGFTVACLSLARCRARLLPTAAGSIVPTGSACGRAAAAPALSARAPAPAHGGYSGSPKPCPRGGLASRGPGPSAPRSRSRVGRSRAPGPHPGSRLPFWVCVSRVRAGGKGAKASARPECLSLGAVSWLKGCPQSAGQSTRAPRLPAATPGEDPP